MRLIRPSYEIIEQAPGLQGIYDIIEKCGKVSYKSEPKGGETARKFVEARAKEGHGAVLEFGTVYLTFPIGSPLYDKDYFQKMNDLMFYQRNKYSTVTESREDLKLEGVVMNSVRVYCITTNYRVLVENNRLDDLKYLCEPTEFHEKRYAVKFITDIGLGRDFLRHRVMSMVQESTRYVNYAKEKFGEELTFIIPPWIDRNVLQEAGGVFRSGGWWCSKREDGTTETLLSQKYGGTRIDIWLTALEVTECAYMELVNDWSEYEKPWQAQQARGVLPLATKTELVLCGFPDAWIHFFCLRTDIASTGKAHPESEELANPLRDEFIEKGYITEEQLKHDTFAAFDVGASDQNLKG